MEMLKKSNLIPIILSGGSGSRLWPLSRKSYPKQFWPLDGNSELSLLQKTIKRLEPIQNISNPIVICNENHRFIVAEQCREIDIEPEGILLEPFGRNTAPAIILSALHALKKDKDALLIVLSSDHIISNESQFFQAIECSIDYVEKGNLVTFGVLPDRPETGYGYIKVEEIVDINNLEGRKIKEFVEKPNIVNAKKFIEDGRYFWNSGIFMFKASKIVEEFKKFSGPNAEFIKNAYEKSKKDLDFLRIDEESFSKCKNISIDKAVMEKTDLGIVIPLDKGWSDIGSWYSLWKSSEKDLNNNHLKGNVYLEESSNNYIRSENRLIVALGINNSVIVETEDVVFVGDLNKSQEIKKIVNEFRKKKLAECDSHRKVFRPWGNYQSISEGHRWQVKMISVKPGASLSLQMHHHRAEHWIVVKGTANVDINGVTKLLTENQSIHIPLGSKHRVSNPGKLSLELIEVQSGPYLDEDDIIRFNDKYGRA